MRLWEEIDPFINFIHFLSLYPHSPNSPVHWLGHVSDESGLTTKRANRQLLSSHATYKFPLLSPFGFT